MNKPDQKVDFNLVAKDYRKHRAGFPPEFFERLSLYGIGQPHQYVLDLGTGTGTIARGLARKGCIVTGLDPAASLLDEAQLLDKKAGVTINYVEATAENTGLPNSSFDIVTAGQCWHWFNRKKTIPEIKRILKPKGKLVIAYFDWLLLKGNVAEATEKLILQHNPKWHLAGGNGLHPQWVNEVTFGGFTGIETFSFDILTPYSHEAWRGRIRASAGVAAALKAKQVDKFDSELKALLNKDFPQDPMAIPHRVFAVICLNEQVEKNK